MANGYGWASGFWAGGIALGLIGFSLGSLAKITLASDPPPTANLPGVPYAPKLPVIDLKDPRGKPITPASLKNRPVVIIFSIPNPQHGKLQDLWTQVLLQGTWPSQASLLLIEDMSQSLVAEFARIEMARKFKPGSRPMLLLDEQGKARTALGVPKNQTVLLVYDAQGRLIHSDSQPPSPEAAKRVLTLVNRSTP
ncbi:MAG: hypothetical protein IGQ88_02215 [Gloeomargaritaceae cyanobacterium C42_A2020_066]|nr:hypothetical protein [Gloeomargaritaceae cyanobacterium C42_A2020_066]